MATKQAFSQKALREKFRRLIIRHISQLYLNNDRVIEQMHKAKIIGTAIKVFDKVLEKAGEKMKTMHEVYGEPNTKLGKHLCCKKCGGCIDCDDCVCKKAGEKDGSE